MAQDCSGGIESSEGTWKWTSSISSEMEEETYVINYYYIIIIKLM